MYSLDDAGSPVIESPPLLQVVERLLAEPDSLEAIVAAERRRLADVGDEQQVREKAAKRIMRRYSNRSALVGGATGALGVVPGVGTLVASLGGASADLAMSLKWQTEMGLCLALLYGQDIHNPQTRRRVMALAGLGALAGRQKNAAVGPLGRQAFVDFAQQQFQRYGLSLLRRLFARLGERGSRKALEKMAPFGLGIAWGSGVNKVTTTLVGERIQAYLEAQLQGQVGWEESGNLIRR